MGEIVIAYARPDADAADLLIKKLEALGFNVKRDEASALKTARRTAAKKAAAPRIVLWSRHYAATRAKGAALVAARLDTLPVSCLLKTEAVDLRAWHGRADHRGFKRLVADVRSAAGAPTKGAKTAAKPIVVANAKAAKAQKAAKPAKVKSEKKGAVGPALLWLAGAAAAAAGGAAVFMTMH